MKAITAKRTFAGIAALGAAALVLTGCAAETVEEETATTEEAAVVEEAAPALDFLACAVSDEGNWNDNSFNEAVYDGLQLAKSELGVEVAAAESATAENFTPNLQSMVDEGCDVIFSVGFALYEATNIMAEANPMVSFVSIDGGSDQPNVKPVFYDMTQSGYLSGYLAAAYSTTKVVGTSGGVQIDPVTDFMTGYYNGAKAYEAETGTSITVIGWDPVAGTGDFWNSFAPNDPVGKSIAASQLEQGADVLFPVGGDQFGAGSEAIKESGVDAVMVGVDKDIALTSPEYAEYVLTSAEKRMTAATFDIIEDYAVNGNFSVDAYLGTLENEGTDISPFYDFDSKVSQEIKDRLAAIKAGIIDGSIDPRS
ncbi:BMP family ABC transporter substrate-binding protein [Pontimonas sp.]|nr:BMP family ABC transporter substrate-binding protein [Pontimonas sp.]MDA9116811.1 BMP family ABC transporter substrate-binding protein [Pontimonas sp.]